jgi:putative flippase GtrA
MIKKLIDYIKEIMHNEQFQKILRYAFIGSLTTIISFGVFGILAYPVNMNPNMANIISVICAVIFSYVTNKIFVFKSKCGTTRELVIEASSFFSARAVTMVIEVGGVFVLTSLKIEAMISKVIINVVVLILNYLFSQFLVFRTDS